MASPARIDEVRPETLPGDFVEWDEASQSPQPVQSGTGEHGSGVGVDPNPATKAQEGNCALPRPRNPAAGAALSASAHQSSGGAPASHRVQSSSPSFPRSRDVAGQLQASLPGIDNLRFTPPGPNGHLATGTMTGFHDILLRSPWVKADEIAKVARKKWAMVAGVSAAILVTIAAATISLSDHRTAPLVKPAVTPSPTMAANQRHQDAVPTRTHSMVTRPKTMPRPVQKNAARPGEPVLSMNEQLRTPTRLQVKASTTEEAPLPADNLAAGLESSDPIGTVFSSRQQPRLQIPSQQLITVPPDVALGLLIQKRLPVYPMIAQAAHVSGTIVLAVIISKTGTVENLRVVSGPVMLRDSAVNAVRTWHFKPYVLNAQPMAIETIINLRFSLHN